MLDSLGAQKLLGNFLTSFAIGMVSLCANYVLKISDNITAMSRNLVELNMKMEFISESLVKERETFKDHEQRLRSMEKRK